MEEHVDEEIKCSFLDMGLDNRILEAITALKWIEPTLIQEKAIPLMLEGKDILARARTGSGKTAAFVIPVLQQILQRKKTSEEHETTVLVLAPTRELCSQIQKNILELSNYCSRDVTSFDVSPQIDISAQRPLLLEKPDIVVGTPMRVLAHLQVNNLTLKNSLKTLIIDEADLLFSYGCDKDVIAVVNYLPTIYQAILMSATMSNEVKAIKKLVLQNPVILKLKEPELPESDRLTQYHIKCEEEDKFVLIYALFKLNLIQGKSLIFVCTVDRCYRLKLFLEQFGVKSCVLNSEMPATCRCHAVSQFNMGVYDIIIASDERVTEEPGEKTSRKRKKIDEHVTEDPGEKTSQKKKKTDDPGQKTRRKRKTDKEYGVSRGIDFQFVSNVINFDFPSSVEDYIHRVGRTARGNADGTALSFVNSKEMPFLKKVEEYFVDGSGNQKAQFKPYLFKMDELEGFKYRARDAYRAVTKIAVREARLKEIKTELLNSRNLKPYFEDNPRDLQVLKHDKSLHTVKLDSHLKNVPDYIVPSMLKNMVPSQKEKKKFQSKIKYKKYDSKAGRKFQKNQKDPLKSFQFAGFELESKKKK